MMSDITGPQFWENIDPENLDEMQSFVLIEHLRAENNMLFDRAAQRLARIKELEATLAALTAQLQAANVPSADVREAVDTLTGIAETWIAANADGDPVYVHQLSIVRAWLQQRT